VVVSIRCATRPPSAKDDLDISKPDVEVSRWTRAMVARERHMGMFRVPSPDGTATAEGRVAAASRRAGSSGRKKRRLHAAGPCRYGRRPCSRGFSPRSVSPCTRRCAARSVGYTLRVLAVTAGGRVAAASRREACRHVRDVAPQEASATRCASLPLRPQAVSPRLLAAKGRAAMCETLRRKKRRLHAARPRRYGRRPCSRGFSPRRVLAPQEASATRCASVP